MDIRGRLFKQQLKYPVNLAFISVLILILTLGCASTSSLRKENKSYKQAVKEDTIEAYKDFIAEHPDSAHIEDVKKRLVKLEWEKTEKTNTVNAYNNFVKKYKEYPSDSDYVGLAQQNLKKLDEQLALKKSDEEGKKNKRGKKTKISFLKKGKVPNDKEAKAKLVVFEKRGPEKSKSKFLTKLNFSNKPKWTNFFSRGWQRIYTFFKNFFSYLLNPPDVEIDEGSIV
jgi:outer membrane protein assembly factor BamD (BamD/ComL family)